MQQEKQSAMVLRATLKRNTYYDSITLMSLAQATKALPGVDEVGAVMATELNRELLRDSSLLPTAWLAQQATPPGPEDLLLVVRATDEGYADDALKAAEQYLTRRRDTPIGDATAFPVRSLELALQRDSTANLAVISVAGEYAWLEAEQALRHGLHVFLFSDNVPIEQELRLKTLAEQHGLLLMGPDCGTALINGIGLGFSNVVPRGAIGMVGASGTGMQQIMCLLAGAGQGISQAIGTGGRDLSEAIGGIMMRRGLALLANDPQTQVIVLISKPPAERVARELLAAAQLAKPVVVVFLGATPDQFAPVATNIHIATTLTEGAELACSLIDTRHTPVSVDEMVAPHRARLAQERAKLTASQRYIRVLYAGGTLCDEAMLLMSERVGPIASNIPLHPAWALHAGETYRGHTALDLGADEFTRGKPHPMIDPSVRLHYLTQAAEDPQTAVILLDIVLGFCSHENPAAIYVPVINALRAKAAATGRYIPIAISLCGTVGDPQYLPAQKAALEATGALVYESNAEAALAVAELVGDRERS